jgi:hypothetical protein
MKLPSKLLLLSLLASASMHASEDGFIDFLRWLLGGTTHVTVIHEAPRPEQPQPQQKPQQQQPSYSSNNNSQSPFTSNAEGLISEAEANRRAKNKYNAINKRFSADLNAEIVASEFKNRRAKSTNTSGERFFKVDEVDEVINSFFIEFVKNHATITCKQDCRISEYRCEKIGESMQGNILAEIKKTPHLGGKELARLYDEYYNKAISGEFDGQQPRPTITKPAAPQRPVAPPKPAQITIVVQDTQNKIPDIYDLNSNGFYLFDEVSRYVYNLCVEFKQQVPAFAIQETMDTMLNEIKTFKASSNGQTCYNKIGIDLTVNKHFKNFIEIYSYEACKSNGLGHNKCAAIAGLMKNAIDTKITLSDLHQGESLGRNFAQKFEREINEALNTASLSDIPNGASNYQNPPAHNPAWQGDSHQPSYNPEWNGDDYDQKPAVINPNWDGSSYDPLPVVNPNVAPESGSAEWIKQQKAKYGVPANKKLFPSKKCIACREKFDHEKLEEDEEAVERVFLTCGHDMCVDCKKAWFAQKQTCPHSNLNPSDCGCPE